MSGGAAARAAAAAAKTPIPISPAEFTRSDISLSPSPIPVTLAASIAAAARAGLVSEVENRAAEGVAAATPSPATRQGSTPLAENTPIPLSPAEFSASDIDFDVGRSGGSIASLGVGRSVDSIGSLARALAESEYTERTEEDSFGGLPGADEFMREAAAHHAWQTVTSAFSPPRKEMRTETTRERARTCRSGRRRRTSWATCPRREKRPSRGPRAGTSSCAPRTSRASTEDECASPPWTTSRSRNHPPVAPPAPVEGREPREER